MKLGDQIHYEGTEEIVSAVSLAYSQVTNVNSASEVGMAIGPVLAGLSENERTQVGHEFTSRMREWDKAHQGEGRNPYAGIAYHLAPPVGGS